MVDIDLDSIKIEPFIVKLGDQEIELDVAKLFISLQTIDDVSDTDVLVAAVNKALGCEVNKMQALLIFAALKKYLDETEIFELLKNVLGSELSTDTITAPTPNPQTNP